MSCTSCNKSNCSCSDNCPNKVSDITTFDCNGFNVISVPCGASLCDVLALLESYTTNMASELSHMTSVIIEGDTCVGLSDGTYSIQQVIDAILVKLCEPIPCPLKVKINSPLGGVFTSTVENGLAPYTYLWEQQDDLNLIQLNSDPTGTTMTVIATGSESPINFGLLKLTVTDSNGCTASDVFMTKSTL